jgi:hypothetical protein
MRHDETTKDNRYPAPLVPPPLRHLYRVTRVSYPSRRVVIGSRAAARCAGSQLAPAATATSNVAIAANITGSRGSWPGSACHCSVNLHIRCPIFGRANAESAAASLREDL